MPWLGAQSLYVLASRVQHYNGLRLLCDGGVEKAKTLKHTAGLHAWEHGYDMQGHYNDALVVAAHKQHLARGGRRQGGTSRRGRT
jgi:hypothetical protein